MIAAAGEGDGAALGLLESAALELADMVDAVRAALEIPADSPIPVSSSGGMFQPGNGLREALGSALRRRSAQYRFVEALLPPDVGAVIQAARLGGAPLGAESLKALAGAAR